MPIAVISAWISLFESTLSMRFFSTLMILPRSGRIAWVLRLRPGLRGAAGRVALDDEDLGQRGVAHRAVGELAREGRVLERRLAAREVARLARGVAGVGGLDRLADHGARVGGVLLEELREPLVDGRLHEALDRRVAELGLRLPLELRLAELHRDDRREPLADVLALEVHVLLLELPGLAGA